MWRTHSCVQPLSRNPRWAPIHLACGTYPASCFSPLLRTSKMEDSARFRFVNERLSNGVRFAPLPVAKRHQCQGSDENRGHALGRAKSTSVGTALACRIQFHFARRVLSQPFLPPETLPAGAVFRSWGRSSWPPGLDLRVDAGRTCARYALHVPFSHQPNLAAFSRQSFSRGFGRVSGCGGAVAAVCLRPELLRGAIAYGRLGHRGRPGRRVVGHASAQDVSVWARADGPDHLLPGLRHSGGGGVPGQLSAGPPRRQCGPHGGAAPGIAAQRPRNRVRRRTGSLRVPRTRPPRRGVDPLASWWPARVPCHRTAGIAAPESTVGSRLRNRRF